MWDVVFELCAVLFIGIFAGACVHAFIVVIEQSIGVVERLVRRAMQLIGFDKVLDVHKAMRDEETHTRRCN
jgi:hypothetical protein